VHAAARPTLTHISQRLLTSAHGTLLDRAREDEDHVRKPVQPRQELRPVDGPGVGERDDPALRPPDDRSRDVERRGERVLARDDEAAFDPGGRAQRRGALVDGRDRERVDPLAEPRDGAGDGGVRRVPGARCSNARPLRRDRGYRA